MRLSLVSQSLLFTANLFAILCAPIIANAQMYGSPMGAIQISGVWNDSVLIAQSNDMSIELNYETAEFRIELNKSTLRTGVRDLDQRLSEMTLDPIIYKGKLGIDHINTKRHPPQHVDVVGYLTCSPHYVKIKGTAIIEHIFKDYYACVLRMNFDLSLQEINFPIDLPGLDDEIQVEVIQTLLKRED